jgi:hypothetical protein
MALSWRHPNVPDGSIPYIIQRLNEGPLWTPDRENRNGWPATSRQSALDIERPLPTRCGH